MLHQVSIPDRDFDELQLSVGQFHDIILLVSIPDRDFDELQSRIPSESLGEIKVSIPDRDFDELQLLLLAVRAANLPLGFNP